MIIILSPQAFSKKIGHFQKFLWSEYIWVSEGGRRRERGWEIKRVKKEKKGERGKRAKRKTERKKGEKTKHDERERSAREKKEKG